MPSLPYNEEQYVEISKSLENYIAKQIPKFKVKSKEDSKLMKFLSWILFFNKGFKDRYTTTIYPNVYFPKLPYKVMEDEKWNTIKYSTILCHEYIHLYDEKRFKVLYKLAYLFPQILALLALLAPFVSWFFLLFLLFALPIPSLGRALIEYRGYTASIAMIYWLTGSKNNIEWIVKHFHDSSYYWMFPFKKYMTKKFEKQFYKLQNNIYPFKELRNIHSNILP